MKKLRLINILASGLIILTIVGCSSAAASEEQATTEETTSKEASKSSTDLGEIDVYGEVSEVIGNEVTLKLLEIPDMSAMNREKGTGGEKPADKAEGSAPAGDTTNGAAAGATAGTPGGGGMREKIIQGKRKPL